MTDPAPKRERVQRVSDADTPTSGDVTTPDAGDVTTTTTAEIPERPTPFGVTVMPADTDPADA